MTKYRVTNGWWEGVVEAEEADFRRWDSDDRYGRLCFFGSNVGPMGEILVGIVTPHMIAIQKDKLSEEVVHEDCRA